MTARTPKAIGIALTAALLLSACGGSSDSSANSSASSSSSAAQGATINGSGASSQANAQQAWRDHFSGGKVNYDSVGSGSGREQFIGGQVSFAGTDSALKAEELTAAAKTCSDTGVVEIPVYISPIAVAYNLPGVKELNLSAENIAKIFSGKITKWSDPAIAADNSGVTLPDIDIIPVNRADKSGTTKNFTKYLEAASGGAWEHKAEEVWPISGTQSAEKTSGVVQLASSTEGAITYADASQLGKVLQAAKVKVDGKFIAYSPEAAAALVDGSPASKDATDTILTVDLVRDGSIANAYPIVLVSYLVACQKYDKPETAASVKAYLEYVASAEGQKVATEAGAGNAPISDALREKVNAALATIK